MVAWGKMSAKGKGVQLLQAACCSGASAAEEILLARERRAFRGGTLRGAAAVSVSLKGTDRLFLPLTHSSKDWHRRPRVKKLHATPKS